MKIALIGYGKMGKMIEQIAISRGHEIVSIIDIDNQQDFDSPEFASADVAIEFTAPQVAYGNYLKAFSHGVKVVSGSTVDERPQNRRGATVQRGGKYPLLGIQLLDRSGHLFGGKPLSRQDNERIPAV